VLVGGGGHAAVVAEAAHLAGRPVAGFLDDAPGASLGEGCPRLGGLDLLDEEGGLPDGCALLLCLGDLALRRRLTGRLEGRAAGAVVHPRAIVAPSAHLAGGVFVGPGAIVHARARVEAHAIVNSGAIVEHDCIVGENAHLAPGCALAGGARIGAGALVGMRACVLPGVAVGEGATVGAGSVVRADAPAGATVVGAPARVV